MDEGPPTTIENKKENNFFCTIIQNYQLDEKLYMKRFLFQSQQNWRLAP